MWLVVHGFWLEEVAGFGGYVMLATVLSMNQC